MGKKKYLKGIKSLQKEINIHEDKLKKAQEDKKLELAEYYIKEIENLKAGIEEKQLKLLPRSKKLKKKSLL